MKKITKIIITPITGVIGWAIGMYLVLGVVAGFLCLVGWSTKYVDLFNIFIEAPDLAHVIIRILGWLSGIFCFMIGCFLPWEMDW